MKSLKSKSAAIVFFFLFGNLALAQITISNVACIKDGGFGSVEVSINIQPGYRSAGPFTFEWEGPADSDFYSNQEDIFDITMPGIYTVTVHNSYGCSVPLSANIAYCVEKAQDFYSSNFIESNSGLIISPNPAKDFIKLQNSAMLEGPLSLKLFDMEGNAVKAWSFDGLLEHDITLKLKGVTSGFYILEYKAKNDTSQRQKIAILSD